MIAILSALVLASAPLPAPASIQQAPTAPPPPSFDLKAELDRRLEARRLQGLVHGVPRQQRQPRPGRERHGRAEQQREGEAGPGRGLPRAVQPAPAGGLVLGHHDQALVGPVVGARGDQRIGGRRLLDDLDGHARQQGRVGRGQPGRVERWARARLRGHNH